MTEDPRRRTGITIQAGPAPLALWPALETALVRAAAELGVKLRAMPVGAPDLDVPCVNLDAAGTPAEPDSSLAQPDAVSGTREDPG
ncbi:hypothetical protein [Parafrankia sp. EUN1f]|uniref:hypothetical protein n=1 Tax=Parafrankia sp. EUN1f TaxID=102897 RepID=UPI0001C4645F|nr:hypothetical protein [Parafrankia sp. EUN1f]EFC80895.1 hypothetical protein FrEUN1fDRAFT_5997 [Parafrankia sp. EUN1f]